MADGIGHAFWIDLALFFYSKAQQIIEIVQSYSNKEVFVCCCEAVTYQAPISNEGLSKQFISDQTNADILKRNVVLRVQYS